MTVISHNRFDDTNDNYEDDDDDDEIIGSNWKEGVADRARNAYLERQSNNKSIMKLVYGKYNQNSSKNIKDSDDEEDGQIGGLFKSISKLQSQIHQEKQQRDIEECPFFESHNVGIRNWLSADNKSLIVNKFVTGKWKSTEDAEQLLALDDMSDGDSEVYGDFEDLETGEKFEGKTVKKDDDSDDDMGENEKKEKEKMSRKRDRVEEMNMTRAELMAKKLKLKAKFDSEYDNPELKDSHRIEDDEAFYEKWKAEAEKQAELNRKEFSGLDDHVRSEIEGFRAGLYVRLSFKNIPCEFVTNFDASYPILIGALNMSEENIGLVNCEVKKHRWYRKVLKTGDPLIISLGWRRFQTVPVYSKREDDLKYRFLKYTPNHINCHMSFYGPITPQGTGFLAVQTVTNDIKEMKRIGFRIAATGSVKEIDKSSSILKKLKLVGTPIKIYQKSAFIKGKLSKLTVRNILKINRQK